MASIPEDLYDKFEFKSYGHALEILDHSFPKEWQEIQEALQKLEISIEDLRAQGFPSKWRLSHTGNRYQKGMCERQFR